jgi:flagellar P-ring protein precursor FlgI
MRAGLATIAAVAALVAAIAAPASAARVKDLGGVYGPMDNPIIGYGLVVGLPGTGDDAKFVPAIKYLSNMLTNMGANAMPVEVVGAKNSALVMVTAVLGPYSKPNDRLDVSVAAVGNAKSLAGGQLTVCPLWAPGTSTIAIASGSLVVDDEFPTTGRIARGAIVQTEVPTELVIGGKLTFKLQPQKADFSVASRIVDAIHQDMNIDTAAGDAPVARATDAATIEIALTPSQIENPVPFISRIERLTVPGLDIMEARVVINEREGRYSIDGKVEISPVVAGHNGIQVQITSDNADQATTLDNLVEALRRINATPSDVIGILKALESSGALHAKVIRE